MSEIPHFAALDESGRREFWACLALRHCKGLGAFSRARLLRRFGSAFSALQKGEQWEKAGLNRRQAAGIRSGAWRSAARAEWDGARRVNPRILLWTDARYPQHLREVPDAPAFLYARGDGSLLASPAFAVVGSRQATPHGLTIAKYMAQSLSSCGIAIVSGMARGIDCVAHSAALERVGGSIGVLGTGIDRIYPESERRLFGQMEERGLLLSEFPPGTLPRPGHFPVRNRIISGLALGVLVIEATNRSGSLITARLALEQGREVYAVPGTALDPHSEGCQNLIRQGARPVFDAEDVLRDLAPQLRSFGVDVPRDAEPPLCAPPPGPPAPQQIAFSRGDGQDGKIVACLCGNGPMQADALALALAMPMQALNPLLVELEITGRIRRLPGARYEALA